MDWTTQDEGTDIKEPLREMVHGDWERGTKVLALEARYIERLRAVSGGHLLDVDILRGIARMFIETGTALPDA